ncbi:DUF1573 domain-containing protein [bacterium]|nr:DUF1573 domain-containing protein [bacterium]
MLTHTSPRGMSYLAIALGFLPFVLACFVHLARPSVPLALANVSRPALAFDQYLVDLGKIDPTTEVRGTFVFENKGKVPLTIDQVTPSCGCLEPQLSSKSLQPGDTGAVVLRMQPANESPGSKEFFADVAYHDPEPRSTRITFRLEVPERQLSVRPRALMVYQLSSEPTRHVVQVTDTRPNPAQVKSAEINTSWATIDLLDRQIQPTGGITTELEVTVPADVPPGRHEGLITIHTTDPKSPVLRVPVLIHGRPQFADVPAHDHQ